MISLRQMSSVLLAVIVAGTAACNPYACTTDARSATYSARLGQAVAPTSEVPERDSGRVFLAVNEWRGSVTQQNVIASVNVWGFVPTVSNLQVREGTPASPGSILWKSSNGYLVRDSTWNTGIDLFEGPGNWTDMWNLLAQGRAFLEVHPVSGDSVSAALSQVSSSPFSPSCT